MKVNEARVSMWSGILAIPPAIGWYMTTLDSVRTRLPDAMSASLPHILSGLAVLAIVISMIANAVVHSKSHNVIQPVGSPTVSVADPITLKSIMGRTLQNERVILDGYAYIGCAFNQVTFVFNGGPCTVTRCSVNGRPRIETSNVQLLNMMALLSILKFLAPEAQFADAVRD
jgi:hypothetical protein